ncbi:hypothetical protein SSX86_009336 [Deinandra increscens subsp. villosa]|uniref:HMA domain-containing protein n=1 Tax=Deinandra increscens subsp. villosa TaxID=3103831 RepID=A0AAP0H5J1_9ASTR
MPESKKLVIKLDIHEDKDKTKALKAVSGVSGIESLAIDLKDQKLTIIGEMNPLIVVGKLDKKWRPEILVVGPAKEPEKKPEEKKPEEKKPEEKKADEDAQKKRKEEEEAIRRFIETQRAYNNPCMCMNQRYCVHLVEEDHRVCVIL